MEGIHEPSMGAAAALVSGTALPEAHEDQLQLGFRLIQNAYNNKIASLEQEARGLRLTCDEQKGQASTLQRRNSALEHELVEAHQRSQQLSEENKELFKTVQQLRRQLSRLEGLKKTVLESIADHQQSECDHEDNKLYMRDEYLHGAMPLTIAAAQADAAQVRGYAGGNVAPQPVLPPVVPAPPQQPAPANPSEGSSVVDGKQFFRKARGSLSYEGFNEFLANIKRLNAQQQTREETLERARGIFGPDYKHLYMEFEQLLNRHAGPMM